MNNGPFFSSRTNLFLGFEHGCTFFAAFCDAAAVQFNVGRVVIFVHNGDNKGNVGFSNGAVREPGHAR